VGEAGDAGVTGSQADVLLPNPIAPFVRLDYTLMWKAGCQTRGRLRVLIRSTAVFWHETGLDEY